MITVPGDEELFLKLYNNEELTSEEQKRYDQIENAAKESLRDSLGEETLKQIEQQFLSDSLSQESIQYCFMLTQYVLSKLIDFPRYQVNFSEGQQTIMIPGESINDLQKLVTGLCILLEDRLEGC